MNNKKAFVRMLAVFALIPLLAALLPFSASADVGPKASVTVRFRNLPEEECWATLLAETVPGPYEAFPGGDRDEYYDSKANYSGTKPDRATWNALTDYKDADGFYYLQYCFRIDETKEFEWGYYPPDIFKILIYFPAHNTFFVSGKTERVAFHSYYTVDASGIDTSKSGVLEGAVSFDLTREITGLAGRILITVLIEMAVAILFGFRHKKPLLLILGVNAVTQILLNTAITVLSHHAGIQLVLLAVLGLEVLVTAAEATVYCIYMKRLQAGYDNERYIIGYTAVANVTSFVAGLIFALIFPYIF